MKGIINGCLLSLVVDAVLVALVLWVLSVLGWS